MSTYRIRSSTRSDGPEVEQGSIEISKTILEAVGWLITSHFWSYSEEEDQWIDDAEVAEQVLYQHRAAQLARSIRAVLALVPPAPAENLGLLLERMDNGRGEVEDFIGILGGKRDVLERLAEVLETGQVRIGKVEARRPLASHGVASKP